MFQTGDSKSRVRPHAAPHVRLLSRDHRSHGLLLIVLSLWLGFGGSPTGSQVVRAEGPAPATGALKDFALAKDDAYRYELVDQGRIGESRWVRLHMVSQHWKGTDWKHVVWILVPNQAIENPDAKASQSALLLIGGGNWKKEWGEAPPATLEPKGEMLILKTIAEASGSPAVAISQVPFQPMFNNLNEDALIAESFKRFIQEEGDDWPLLMPMVRSAVRAMDTAQTFSREQWNLNIQSFTLTGASKRGWTTWLTSAVDPRVQALAPMVIDMLNMPVQMKHQMETWGAYSDEIADYTTLSLQKYLQTPHGDKLVRIVDPYRYRDRLLQPKLLIFGTNDRYWPLDACNKYWDDLRGDKYLLYTPNQGHGIQDVVRLAGTIHALHRSRNGDFALPKLQWKNESADGNVTLQLASDLAPDEVSIWFAKSKTRDFRDASWNSIPASEVDATNHRGILDIPKDQYLAAFGEWVFELGEYPAYFSTNVILVEPNP